MTKNQNNNDDDPRNPIEGPGAILFLEEMARLGLLPEEGQLSCFAKLYDSTNDNCTKLCNESDRCATAMFKKSEDAIRAAGGWTEKQLESIIAPLISTEELAKPPMVIERPVEDVTDTRALQLPTEFAWLNNEILKLKHVSRHSQKTIIHYAFRSWQLVSIPSPVSETITLVFPKTRPTDFQDSKGDMFIGMNRFPNYPAINITEADQAYGFELIKQAYSILDTKLALFDRRRKKGESNG